MMPPIFLIDTHCHLDAERLFSQHAAVMSAAWAADVRQIVIPAVSAANFARQQWLQQRYGCAVAYGLHPLAVGCRADNAQQLTQIAEALQSGQACAVGEIGLDFYHGQDGAEEQEWVFVQQLQLAQQHQLPVLLHSRRAVDRVLKYLRRYPVVGGIAHAFNGSEQQAEVFLQLGFKLGFGGAMTFSGSQRIRRLASHLPLSAVVLETDAPDMAPQWAQGQVNQPANIRRFAAELADLRKIEFTELTQACLVNTWQALPKLAAGFVLSIAAPST